MHFSRMRTASCNCRFSCHACPPDTHTPCHACPTMYTPMHTPAMYTPVMHATLPCTPPVTHAPAMHTPCHACPLPHTHPCHTCPPPMHALPATHTLPPCHARPPTATHAPPAIHTLPLPRTPSPAMHACPPPRRQNSLHTLVKILTCRNFVAGDKYKDPVSHMCVAGTVVASLSLTQKVAGFLGLVL